MPSVTIHLLLAERVLEVWCRGSGAAPFDLSSDEAVNAFRQGAFGPDLGYFPGGWRPLSDLAHCIRSGDLTRALVSGARAPAELAFALGWLTHVLADRWLHPLVGQAVGEVVDGTPGRFIEGDRAPLVHIRVEAGLDAWFARRNPELRRRALQPVFRPDSVHRLAGAFEEAYEATFDPTVMLRSHLAAVRGAAHGLHLAALTGRMMGDSLPMAGLGDLLARRWTVAAYLLPAAPPPWLIRAVRTVIASFPERFMETWRGGLHDLPNVNLDTGRPDGVEADHGGTRRALALLASMGSCPLHPAVQQAR